MKLVNLTSILVIYLSILTLHSLNVKKKLHKKEYQQKEHNSENKSSVKN